MRHLIMALVAGAVVTAGLAVFFAWYAALVPGLLVAIGLYLVLAQRAMKQIAELSERAQKEMASQRLDRAIEIFKSGFALERDQFWIGPILHANLGMLLYVKGDFDASRPHLEQGLARNYLARAMLACYHFRQKDAAKMREQFELAVKHGKKEGLVWTLYAFCLSKLGAKDDALQVLGRAVRENPTDDKLKGNLLALQNNKKLKLKGYAPQVYQFHVEAPPPEFFQGGRRVVWERR